MYQWTDFSLLYSHGGKYKTPYKYTVRQKSAIRNPIPEKKREISNFKMSKGHFASLVMLLLTFIGLVYGVIKLEWYFK